MSSIHPSAHPQHALLLIATAHTHTFAHVYSDKMRSAGTPCKGSVASQLRRQQRETCCDAHRPCTPTSPINGTFLGSVINDGEEVPASGLTLATPLAAGVSKVPAHLGATMCRWARTKAKWVSENETEQLLSSPAIHCNPPPSLIHFCNRVGL